MHSIIQWIEFGIVTCIFIMCTGGAAGTIYIFKLVLRWEEEEKNSSCCPNKTEPRG